MPEKAPVALETEPENITEATGTFAGVMAESAAQLEQPAESIGIGANVKAGEALIPHRNASSDSQARSSDPFAAALSAANAPVQQDANVS